MKATLEQLRIVNELRVAKGYVPIDRYDWIVTREQAEEIIENTKRWENARVSS